MYEVEQVTMQSLMRNFRGLYSEIFIQNNTRENIVAIDCHSNKTVVPPTSENQLGREQIVIWSRKSTNPTVDFNNVPQQLPGIRIIIPKHELAHDGGMFIKEVDLVICTEAMALTTTHPHGSVSYADAAELATEQLVQAIETAPTIKITANDPEGRYNKLYTTFGDVLIEINVTNIFGEAELRITVLNGTTHDNYTVELNDFLNSANDYLELNDLPITYLTTNKAKAKQYAYDLKKISQAEVDELLKKASTKASKDAVAIKDQYATELQLKATEIKRLMDEIKTIKADKESSDRKLNELESICNIHSMLQDKSLKEQEYVTKLQESINKRNISENDRYTSDAKRSSAEKENNFKFIHLIAAASIPTALTIILKLIEMHSDSK